MRRPVLLPASPYGRVLVVNALIASIGFAGFAVASAVFFTSQVGLSQREVGLGLSIGGAVRLVSSIPAGWLADRVDTRDLVVVSSLVAAVLPLGYTVVHSLAGFIVTVALLEAALGAASVGRSALLAALVPPAERVNVSAYMRSYLNIGFALGAFMAGIVISLDTRPAYLALLVLNVIVEIAVTAMVVVRLPRIGPGEAASGVADLTLALRDLPFLAVSVLAGAGRIAQTVLSLGLPLWIVAHTSAPRVLAGWLLGLNAAIVVLLQVRASRGIESAEVGARAFARAGAAFALAFLAIGASGFGDALVASLLLLAGLLVLTLGELWASAAEWALRFELADPRAQGRYGGVFALGESISDLTGPVLVTTLTSTFLFGGWIALAVLVLVLGAAMLPAVRWAERTAPRASVAPSG